MMRDELPALSIPGVSVQLDLGGPVRVVLPAERGAGEVPEATSGTGRVLQDRLRKERVLPLALSIRDARAEPAL